MRIVFHGENAASFSYDFQRLVGEAAQISVLPDVLTDPAHDLNRLGEFWSSADFFVVSVPSNADTVGMVNAESFAEMRASAVILNVGRGPTLDERSLYEALKDRRIAGAIIDLVHLSLARSSQHPAFEVHVPRIAERRDDATHVGLDSRNDQLAQANDCRQYQSSRRWQTTRQ